MRALTRTALAVLVVAAGAGCAGYAGSVEGVRSALLAGDKPRALYEVDQALEVEEPDHYPIDLGGDEALLVLERGSILQGLGEHEPSALDYRVADKNLELLDLKNDTAGNIAKFVFSDDSTVYKAPAYEKLLLNTMGMINYLALGDLEGARVEARRLAVMQRFLSDEESEREALLELGSYLAGFTFEMSGRPEEALRYYDEALATAPGAGLAPAIRRLARCTTFRTDRLRRVIGEEVSEATCEPLPEGKGTILVVTQTGLAPHKVAARIPIGAALVIAGNVMYGPGLGMANQRKATELQAKGLLTWINFPILKRSKVRFDRAAVRVDGKSAGTSLRVDVSRKVIDAWDAIKGTLMVAAITRMITRAVAGEAAQRAAEGGGAAGGLALLAGLAVQGAMVAADTPDTRSWVTLPDRAHVSRATVDAGRHEVVVDVSGPGGSTRVKREVQVPPGGFVVVSVATMR